MEKKKPYKSISEGKRGRGRPSAITPAIIDKLDYAFSIGCNDTEALAYADISKSAFYRWMEKNPEYRQRKEALKAKPVLKARKAAIEALESDNEKEKNLMARWYLEKRRADEFGNKTDITIDSTGTLTIEDREKALDGFLRRFIDE